MALMIKARFYAFVLLRTFLWLSFFAWGAQCLRFRRPS
jgi:hypothetical protein